MVTSASGAASKSSPTPRPICWRDLDGVGGAFRTPALAEHCGLDVSALRPSREDPGGMCTPVQGLVREPPVTCRDMSIAAGLPGRQTLPGRSGATHAGGVRVPIALNRLQREVHRECAADALRAFDADFAAMLLDNVAHAREPDAHSPDFAWDVATTVEPIEHLSHLPTRDPDAVILYTQYGPVAGSVRLSHQRQRDRIVSRAVLDRIAQQVVDHSAEAGRVPICHQGLVRVLMAWLVKLSRRLFFGADWPNRSG